jgi:hypothetical protein
MQDLKDLKLSSSTDISHSTERLSQDSSGSAVNDEGNKDGKESTFRKIWKKISKGLGIFLIVVGNVCCALGTSLQDRPPKLQKLITESSFSGLFSSTGANIMLYGGMVASTVAIMLLPIALSGSLGAILAIVSSTICGKLKKNIVDGNIEWDLADWAACISVMGTVGLIVFQPDNKESKDVAPYYYEFLVMIIFPFMLLCRECIVFLATSKEKTLGSAFVIIMLSGVVGCLNSIAWSLLNFNGKLNFILSLFRVAVPVGIILWLPKNASHFIEKIEILSSATVVVTGIMNNLLGVIGCGQRWTEDWKRRSFYVFFGIAWVGVVVYLMKVEKDLLLK